MRSDGAATPCERIQPLHAKVGEEPPYGSTEKPAELYSIIEHFCNGRRRLELFGEEHNARPGWLTLGAGYA